MSRGTLRSAGSSSRSGASASTPPRPSRRTTRARPSSTPAAASTAAAPSPTAPSPAPPMRARTCGACSTPRRPRPPPPSPPRTVTARARAAPRRSRATASSEFVEGRAAPCGCCKFSGAASAGDDVVAASGLPVRPPLATARAGGSIRFGVDLLCLVRVDAPQGDTRLPGIRRVATQGA